MSNSQDNPNQGPRPAEDNAFAEQAAEPNARPEPEANEAAENGQPEDAEATIVRLQRERDELESKFLRAQADYQNFQRRAQQNVTQAREEQVRALAKSLVTVMDHFDRALEVDPNTSSTEDVLKGLQIVHQELVGALNRFNIQRIDAQPGEPLDPNRHEAMMRTPAEQIETNHVVQQFQPGYALNDKPIRPAQVSVAE